MPWIRLFAILAVVTLAGGAGCPQFLHNPMALRPPPVFSPQPTLADVIGVVNGNRDLVQSLYASDASISVPLAPTLRCDLAMERPRRFRLRGSTSLTGPEVDLGSNDELFWFWVRTAQPPAVFTCRHDQFQQSAARQVIPVEPEWLVQAFGMSGFDAGVEHGEPVVLRGGKIEVRSGLPTPQGTMTKVTVVDAARGWLLEQHLYDPAGQRLASAITSNHWRDPGTGAVLPKRIEIQWPATHFKLTITVHNWIVNQIPVEPGQLWGLPDYPGYPVVDLGSRPLTAPAAAPSATPMDAPDVLRPTAAVGPGWPTWR